MTKTTFSSRKNTKKEGVLRFLIYFEPKDSEFIGICMDLGIIKTGKNPVLVEQDVTEAAMGYVETVCKENLSDKLLNQKPPKEYIEVFNDYIAITSGNKEFVSLGKRKEKQALDLTSMKTFLKPLVGLCHVI